MKFINQPVIYQLALNCLYFLLACENLINYTFTFQKILALNLLL